MTAVGDAVRMEWVRLSTTGSSKSMEKRTSAAIVRSPTPFVISGWRKLDSRPSAFPLSKS